MLGSPVVGDVILSLLERSATFQGVSRVVLGQLVQAAREFHAARGEFLWHAGDPALDVTLIRSGLVKVVRRSAGKTVICGIFGPLESVGDLAALKGIPFPADAIVATEAAAVIQIPRDLVLACVEQDPKLALNMACNAQTKVASLHRKIEVLSAGSVEVRLATLLLDLYARFGDDFDDGTSRVPVTLSRRELADLVGTTFETTIRVMSRWRDERVVDTQRTGFAIGNLTALRALAGRRASAAPSES